MRRSYILAVALAAALSFPLLANAAPGGEGDNTNCNGQGNPRSPCAGQGGQGGAGGAGGNAASNAVSNARASARASAVGVGVGIGQGGRASASGGAASATGGNASVTVSGAGGGGSYTYNEANGSRRVPDVSAPAIWSNNPCVVALSGGVAVAGFGASFGGGIEDRDCTRRANAQHLNAMGEQAAAREVLCENAEVRAAFARVGRPCAADVRAPVVTPAPIQQVALPPAQAQARPDWCYTRDREVLARRECRQ